jgi:signal recognition particle subunit SRP54
MSMFDKLSDRLGGVFDRLRGRGALNEADVREAMREVRVALLEADVALSVVRAFVDKVTEQAVGAQVLKSVTPGQQVVKIVNDALVEMLGAEQRDLNLAVAPPAIIMMVGLQGSGKTTTTAKIARMLKAKQGKKVLMASLDVNRPAAQEQLATLGTQTEVATLPIVQGQMPVDIAKRAMQAAKLQGFDVLILDTAGRLHVDQQLMDEMQAVADALSLMANIVMAWNTSQMQAVLDRWSNRRQVIPPELIGKIAPTRLESINLRGVFRFPVDRYADQILPSRPNASITGTNG